MNQIKYLDLFAGIGGFRTGLTNAGDIFLPVGWCEIDRYAQKAYRALYETEGEFSPFGEIAEHITINHSGSIVTKEPIDLGEYGSIIFDESNLPNFVGDEITIGQLLRDEFSMDMPDDTEDIDIG